MDLARELPRACENRDTHINGPLQAALAQPPGIYTGCLVSTGILASLPLLLSAHGCVRAVGHFRFCEAA